MKNSKKSFASRFEDFLTKRGIKFEIVYSVEGVTSFRLFEIISSRDLALSHIKLPYWQINFYDSVSYAFIVFETY